MEEEGACICISDPFTVVPPLSNELRPHIRRHLLQVLQPPIEPVLQTEPVEVEGAIPVLKHSTLMQAQRTMV